MGSFSLAVAEKVYLVVLGAGFIGAMVQFFYSFNSYDRGAKIGAALTTARGTIRSSYFRVLFVPTVICVTMMFFRQYVIAYPVEAWFLVTISATTLFLALFRPPCAIVLASSSSPTVSRVIEVTRKAFPFQRVIYFLKPGSLNVMNYNPGAHENLYQQSDGGWKHIVFPLIRISPFVIVDIGVSDTESFGNELEFIMRNRPLLSKTIVFSEKRSHIDGISTMNVNIKWVTDVDALGVAIRWAKINRKIERKSGIYARAKRDIA